ncbi:MAG: ATP-grasp domain-containing protein [bacterium]|nr:ATP-grasp domain-containing protein [bacterium]
MRALVLIATTSYKSQDLICAAERLGVELVVGTDRRQALESTLPGHTIAVDLVRWRRGLQTIEAFHAETPIDAVLGVDDETTLLATAAARAVGRPHNPLEAVERTRDKHAMRSSFRQAGLAVPQFELLERGAFTEEAARRVNYPCVLKPLSLSASRGVLRVDDPAGFVAAFRRIEAILDSDDVAARGVDTRHLLVEDYVAGDEFAAEGLLRGGAFELLALFDKPDALEGPTFEETIYLTPSRLSEAQQREAERAIGEGCAALGLREGPVHAEFRLAQGRPLLLEIAARTIGGLCARTLRFGTGMSLEELVLRHALGLDPSGVARDGSAAGVMMIPVSGAGILRKVTGLDDARTVPAIEEVALTVHRGDELVPLPEGHRYPGFIFARAESADEVERALREAHALIHFELE